VLAEEGRSDIWLVDTGLARDKELLLDSLEAIGLKPERVSRIILTHCHCDHAGNAASFQSRFGAEICAHRDEAPYMLLPRKPYSASGLAAVTHPLHTAAFLVCERAYPVKRCTALTCLESGELLDAPGGDLEVIPCPGHTPGHIALFRRRDGLLLSGDAIMNIIPNLVTGLRRVGLSLPVRLFSSNWQQTRVSARKLAELRPTTLAAGHGPPLTEDTAGAIERWAAGL
jgi:glyoxylase-like metal-dependent hydrolase (beta-lactamase superfamily II)